MADQQTEMDQKTVFRHGVKTSEELMDIINYLESQSPDTRIKASEAIRFAIAEQAARIRIFSNYTESIAS